MILSNLHYNTTFEAGEELARCQSAALTQERKLENWFSAMPDGTEAPRHKIERLFGMDKTSASRALRNLTIRGVLEKTERKVKAPSGRNVYTWRLAQ